MILTYLTKDEERTLEGEHGDARAEAMDYLRKFGDAFDAERLLDIVYVHYPAEMGIYKGSVEELVEYAKKGPRVSVPTTSSTLCMDLDQWKEMGVPEELAELQMEVVEPHREMGVLGTYTCTPYLLGFVPPKNSYIASVESSAVIYFNSMLGAWTNRGGIFTKFSAVCGKYPEMGYMRKENRKGTHLFEIDVGRDNLKSFLDYNLLGIHIGSIVGSEVPVMDGIRPKKQENIIGMGATLATSGSVSLYHIPGVTAEARTLEDAFQGDVPVERCRVSDDDLLAAREQVSTIDGGKVDFVLLGCPHYTLEQLREVAGMLEGKKLARGTKLWVCTNRMTKLAAKWQGYVQVIEAAGGRVVCDSCPVESHMRTSTCQEYGLKTPYIEAMATESGKMARYVKDLIGCETVLVDRKECIKAAISGKTGV